jgi:hypothetical protein
MLWSPFAPLFVIAAASCTPSIHSEPCHTCSSASFFFYVYVMVTLLFHATICGAEQCTLLESILEPALPAASPVLMDSAALASVVTLCTALFSLCVSHVLSCSVCHALHEPSQAWLLLSHFS